MVFVPKTFAADAHTQVPVTARIPQCGGLYEFVAVWRSFWRTMATEEPQFHIDHTTIVPLKFKLSHLACTCVWSGYTQCHCTVASSKEIMSI